ncbi:MAG: hypothetical protein AB1Z98_17355 [Nannocystaceae bacterium]
MKTTFVRSALLVLGLSSIACSPVLHKVRAGKNTATYYTAEGGVVIRGGEENAYSYCVMPPAQGVRQRAGKSSAKVTAKAGSKVDIDFAEPAPPSGSPIQRMPAAVAPAGGTSEIGNG